MRETCISRCKPGDLIICKDTVYTVIHPMDLNGSVMVSFMMAGYSRPSHGVFNNLNNHHITKIVKVK